MPPTRLYSDILNAIWNKAADMIRIDLSKEELNALNEILAAYLSDLRMEIADTDNLEFRGTLKGREHLVNGLLERLAAAPRGD